MRFFGVGTAEEAISWQIFMGSEDAIIVVDRHLNIVMFNRQAENVFSYKSGEVTGQPFSLLVPEAMRDDYQDTMTRFIKDGTQRRQLNEGGHIFTGLRKGGEEFQTRTTISRCQDGRRPVYILTIRDISDEQKTEEELLKLASVDPLTGAFNRREFIALAEREVRRARRYTRPLSLLVLDLDDFQGFNTLYGHAAGDRALQRVTSICCNMLRNVDLFGRWSGGEFIALLPETSSENAVIIAERLRRAIGESNMALYGENIHCTVSIGISEFKMNENTIDNPVARAVAAVTRAKGEGRNRVCRHTEN